MNTVRFYFVTILAIAAIGVASRPQQCAQPNRCCATNVATAAVLPDKSLYQTESEWTADSGKKIKLADLRGRFQVVTMFFASCQYACPMLVRDMKRIEAALPERYRDQTRFVLVTIDTQRDTVDALWSYRQRHQLPDERWTLLRGSADDTLELAALLGVKFSKDAQGQFAHSNLITLLSPEGEILHQQRGLGPDVGPLIAALEKSAK